MAEDHKCIMVDALKRMRDDIEKNEQATCKNVENMHAIITSTALAKQVMDQIQKTQDAQNLTAEKNQAAMVKSNNEIKEASIAGFQAMRDAKIEEKRLADVKKAEDEEKKLAEDKRIKEKQDDENKEAKKWKKRLLIGLYISIFLMALNFGMGWFVKYAPTWIGLPAANATKK